MRVWKCLLLLLGIGAILATPVVYAAEKAADCGLVTFEGIVENAQVGSPAGHPTVTFGTSWRAVINSDAGGIGTPTINRPPPRSPIWKIKPISR